MRFSFFIVCVICGYIYGMFYVGYSLGGLMETTEVESAAIVSPGKGSDPEEIIKNISKYKNVMKSMDKVKFQVRESSITKGTYEIMYRGRLLYDKIPSENIAETLCKDYNDVVKIHISTLGDYVGDIHRTLDHCYSAMEEGLTRR